MGNNTKYDDLTLMQYADGELDKVASKQLEQDLIDNQELQDRLLVFTATREAMIGVNTKIPKHIEDLIDQQDGISEDDKVIRFSEKDPVSNGNIGDGSLAYGTDNKVANFFRNHPIQSFAASVMFGLLIGSQDMQGLYTSPEAPWQINNESFEMLQMSKNIKEEKPFNAAKVSYKDLDDAVTLSTDNKVRVTPSTSFAGLALKYEDRHHNLPPISGDIATSVKPSSRIAKPSSTETQLHDTILSQFIDKLKNDPTIKEGEVKVKGGTVQLVHSFVNTNKQPCKLIEANNQYSIVCQGDEKNWNVLFNSLLKP